MEGTASARSEMGKNSGRDELRTDYVQVSFEETLLPDEKNAFQIVKVIAAEVLAGYRCKWEEW